jgi:transcriptional regulator with XRE-family HTH domain
MVTGMALYPEPVDVHVGTRIKHRRILLGLSQEKLAASIELTFQQLQKYESGANRVSSGRLYQIARLLGVEVPYFFEGIGTEVPAAEVNDTDLLARRETLKFVRNYTRISDDRLRRQVIELIEAIADASDEVLPAKPAKRKRKRR